MTADSQGFDAAAFIVCSAQTILLPIKVKMPNLIAKSRPLLVLPGLPPGHALLPKAQVSSSFPAIFPWI